MINIAPENMEEIFTPTGYCEKQANSYIEKTSVNYRKKKGQFFTSPKIALFMAELSYDKDSETLKILDPGAGAGILSCAICELSTSKNNIKIIEVDAYEDDHDLAKYLKESFEYASKWLNQFNIKFNYMIIEKDFILDSTDKLGVNTYSTYDIIIGNPPYFKIAKNDPQSQAAIEFVYGQPNIYSLFMGVATKLLKNNALLVFITPRSYTTGPYFKAFRKIFFELMNPERIHLFESRKKTFRKDSVLQENIIIKARKSIKSETVQISSSDGINDIDKSHIHIANSTRVLFEQNGDILLRLPIDEEDENVLSKVDQWTGNLHKFGMEISTGPVVPFRSKNFLSSGQNKNSEQSVPLLWMTNVYAMKIQWPNNGYRGKEKPQFILDDNETRKRKLLLDNSTYVLLRRFSAKEQQRRLTSSPFFKGTLKSERIGIENHLNYIYRPCGIVTDVEALGLSGLFNSSLLDRYFRISNGNTQVSATEIRAMPLPSLPIIIEIGASLKKLSHTPTFDELDNIIWSKI